MHLVSLGRLCSRLVILLLSRFLGSGPTPSTFDSSLPWQEVATALGRQEDQDRQHASLDGDAGARGLFLSTQKKDPRRAC